jgi:hypothetical protein
MEKNTKILLGLGAVIAAYLILKPKKAIAQTIISEDERDCNIQYAMSAKPQDMPSVEQRALRQANFIKRCMEEKERKNNPHIYRDFPHMCPDGRMTYDDCKPYTPTTSEY